MLLFAVSFLAVAQTPSIDGKWTAQVPGRGGGAATERIYTFKQTGATFTGSFPLFMEIVAEIKDGTIAADGKITFTSTFSFNDNPVEQKWTGELAGDTLKLTNTGGRGGPQSFEAKRVK
jgi:hypothetical protein